MVEGLWIVRFYGPQGNGGGVVVLQKGQILGGDSGFVFTGSYDLKDDVFSGKVLVHNFDPSIPSVLGVRGDINLILEGKLQAEIISGTGALAIAPSAKIVFRMTKYTN